MLFLHSGESRVTEQGAICEVYSPPRVSPIGEKEGLGAGWSLDITIADAQGRPWDFDDAACRARARRLVQETKPLLLIGPPMRRWFSQLQMLNRSRTDPNEFQENFERACRHLAFVLDLYQMQVDAGR